MHQPVTCGRDADRPQLAACLDFMQPGDALVVPALDRLSRSLQDLITVVADLRRGGVGFTSLHENLDTTPGGRLVFHVFAAHPDTLTSRNSIAELRQQIGEESQPSARLTNGR